MATTDIGRVTPIWRGFYSAATTYELNDIVIDTAGSVWWHKSEELTTGVIPEAGEIWDAVIDMSIFSGLIQAAITTAQTALAAAQAALAEVTADAERAETAADNAENSAAAASESAAGVGALAQAAERSAEAAAGSATGAAGSAQAAAGSKSDAEAYAVGKRGGEDVGSTDPTYHNNAKFYAEQAASEAEAAAQSAEDAQEVLDSIPEDYTELNNDVGDLKNICLHYWNYRDDGFSAENPFTLADMPKNTWTRAPLTVIDGLGIDRLTGQTYWVYLENQDIQTGPGLAKYRAFHVYSITRDLYFRGDVSYSASGPITPSGIEWHDLSDTYKYIISGKSEPGNIDSNGGFLILGSKQNFNYSHCEYLYETEAGAKLKIVFDADFMYLRNYTVFYYAADGSYLSKSSAQTVNGAELTVPSSAKYFKFSLQYNSTVGGALTKEKIWAFKVLSSSPITQRYNQNIINTAVGDSLAFKYLVSTGVQTTGRLLLPPNYTVDGENVPLIVYVHGSGGMVSWDSKLGAITNGTYLPYLQYLANEGFAVFDCYPWTDEKTVDSTAFSPVGLSVCKRSYMAGIRYVCDRYNVDINRVSLLCKSQGGQLGHWAITQDEFPFRAICLFAPANGIDRTNLFYNENCRRAIDAYADFDATSEERTEFITRGKLVESGDFNALVKSLFDKNKMKILSMVPYVNGITNGKLSSDSVDYPGFWEEITERSAKQFSSGIPAWMAELGIPGPAELDEEPHDNVCPLMPFAWRNDYVKVGKWPSKFWCAWDDGSVSSYSNYAIYYWLCNGGSDTEFRTLDLNTGGHHAMDNDERAAKTSGTTALGITYTDMPVAYVEVVQFVRSKYGG